MQSARSRIWAATAWDRDALWSRRIPRILLAPAKDVAQVIGRPKRQLRQRRKIRLHFIVCPYEAIARVRQPLVCPIRVGLQGLEDDEQGKRRSAITTPGHEPRPRAHLRRSFLHGLQLESEQIHHAPALLALDHCQDVEKTGVIVRSSSAHLQDVIASFASTAGINQPHSGHGYPFPPLGHRGLVAIPILLSTLADTQHLLACLLQQTLQLLLLRSLRCVTRLQCVTRLLLCKRRGRCLLTLPLLLETLALSS
mmetsp:Transcript_45743/g.99342  ORF Transcript_45743/g.99342 Transcript_45743/m.99342 type:complete len:253 (-) Transcript_45743:227-985(-)